MPFAVMQHQHKSESSHLWIDAGALVLALLCALRVSLLLGSCLLLLRQLLAVLIHLWEILSCLGQCLRMHVLQQALPSNQTPVRRCLS